MKVLFDFSPIKSGGGAQLAINFLNLFSSDFHYDVLVSDAFPFDINKLELSCTVIVTSSKIGGRLFFERFYYKKLIEKNNYTHVYTFFGAGLPKIKGVKQVTGVAYPIICNDDSPYWSFLPTTFKLKKKLVNYFRKKRLRTADHIIFETEVMQRRCCDVLNFKQENTSVLAPTPTSFLNRSTEYKNSKVTKFLILSGLDYHKNIWRLIEILPRVKKEKLKLKFVLSSTLQNVIFTYKGLIKDINEELICEYFDFKGHIQADQIQSVYDEIDVVLNIADLESFSNNYMEAWVAGKPILASNRDFAKHICKHSAIYVEPHNQDSLFQGLKDFSEKNIDIEKLTIDGHTNLISLPKFNERVDKIIRIIIS